MRDHRTSGTRPFVLQIVGYKNSGKTTLAAALIRLLKQSGLSVGTVKHDAHDFTMDTPGTDTWRHQEAGADVTAISSSLRTAVLRNQPEPLEDLLAYMEGTDIVLVEGFKRERYPKLAIIRRPEDRALFTEITETAAVAAWPEAKATIAEKPPFDPSTPIFDINDIAGIFALIQSLNRHK